MFRTKWIRNLMGRPHSRRQRRRQTAQTRRPVHLLLESLEERVTPAGGNPTVTQTAGDFNTLQAAIASDTNANTNYVIQITGGITFASSAQITISALGANSTLTIEGQNGANMTLTGNSNRLFDIAAGQTVNLDNLTLTGGGNVTQGGAILDAGGNLTLNGVTVKSNTATGTTVDNAAGGGIYVSASGSLTLNNSVIANNSATATAPGLSGAGGGVYIDGASTVVITHSTLNANKATGGAGANATAAGGSGSDGGAAMGGGLFVGGIGWSVTLTADTVSSNSATGGNGGAGAHGVNAAGTSSSASTTGGNGGNGGSGGSAQGGGLYATGNGTLTILNDLNAPLTHPSNIIGNTAAAGAGGNGGAGGKSTGSASNSNGGNGGNAGNADGGAVFISAGGTIGIGNTAIYGNHAVGANPGGGGSAGTGGSLFKPGTNGSRGDGADTKGGGVYLSGDNTFTMVNSTLAKNTASSVTGFTFGGGMYDNNSVDNNVTLDNNTFTQNSVSGPLVTGAGLSVSFFAGTPALYNNILQGNTGDADLGNASGFLTNASNNFIQNVTPAGSISTTTNIIGNGTPQLGNVQGVGTGGPIFYPVKPGVASVGAGTNTVFSTIANLQGAATPFDQVGGLLSSNGKLSGSISLGAAQPLSPAAPEATAIVAGNASVNYYGTNASQAFAVTVAVNGQFGGTASGGVLSVYLNSDNNNPPTLLGTATVMADGVATLSVAAGALPAGLQVGKYDLIENYSGNASFQASNGAGTLSITSDATTVVPGNATVNSGSNSTFTITVGVNSPDGTVNSGNVAVVLTSGSTQTLLGSATVTGGIATVNVTDPAALSLIAALKTGSYQLTETYADVANGQFAGSSGSGSLTVKQDATLVVPGNASIFQGSTSSFTITAGVNSPAATVNEGSVAFSLVSGNTTTNLGTANVTAGTASLSVTDPAALTAISKLATGSYQLIETYADLAGGQFAGSTGTGTLAVTTSSTTVVAGNATVHPGTTTPFSIVVGVNSPDGTVNSGSVAVSLVANGTTTLLGTGTVAGGTTTVTVSGGPLGVVGALANGSYQLVETYTDVAGGQFASSTGAGSLTVTSTSTTVVAGNATVHPGTTTPFSIVVGVNSPDGTVNSGSVAISLVANGTTTLLGTGTVAGGTTTVTVSGAPLATVGALTTGNYQLVETYTDVAGGQFGTSTSTGVLSVTTSPTTVVAGNATVYQGTTTAFTIGVAVNSPDGTVNSGNVAIDLIANGVTTLLGTGKVAGGTTTVTVSGAPLGFIGGLANGSYQLLETYTDVAGGQFGSSTGAGTLTVTSNSTTVVPGNATVYQSSTAPFSITVGVNSPAGTVNEGTVSITLEANGTSTALGSATVTGGNATVNVTDPGILGTIAALQTGSYQLIETYTDVAGGQFGGSTGTGTLTVTTNATTVVPGNASVNLGSNAAFSIVVGVNSPSGTVNEGSVSIVLVSNSTQTTLGTANVTGGTATVNVTDPGILGTIAALQTGSYQLIETYSDAVGGRFASSTGTGTLAVTVGSTTVVPGNATVNIGSSAAFSITVGVNSPAGTVNSGKVSITLESGNTSTALGTANVTGGTATVNVTDPGILGTIAALQAGNYQLIETYTDVAGGQFASSTGTGTLTVTAASTTVVPGNATVNFGSNSSFTITVGVNTPAGTVNSGTVSISLVSNNTTTDLTPTPIKVVNGIATGSITDATALGVIAALAPGNYQLIETYTDVAGGQFSSSTGTGTLTVNALATTVVPGNASVNHGSTSPFTISATVNSATSTVSGGTVTFDLIYNGSATPLSLGTASVGANGVATLNVTNPVVLGVIAGLQTGSYQIVETYSGNSPFAGSSATGTLTVAAAASTLIPGNATVTAGSDTPFVIPVAVNSPLGTVDSGTVTISLVSGATVTVLGTGTVTGGTATITVTGAPLTTVSGLHSGTYQLIESYSDVAGGQFANSSAFGTLTVNPTPVPATSVIPGNLVVSTNDGITTVSVIVNSPSGPVNGGTVSISLVVGNSVMVIGSAPVVNGQADVSVDYPVLTAGTYQLIETYSGVTDHFGGSSAMGTLTALPIPPGTAALRLAIDSAALVLLNNPGALMELQLFSEVFLHYTVPMSITALVSDIQMLYPKTEDLGLLAIGAGMFLAQDLQIENPMS